jgi:hypothetical protein
MGTVFITHFSDLKKEILNYCQLAYLNLNDSNKNQNQVNVLKSNMQHNEQLYE